MYQQQLPFSPDQLQQGFLQGIGPGCPPFVPQLTGIQPWLQNYVPAIAGYVAAEIQNQAEKNHLRRFFFNMFGRNNFANEDYISVVQAAADYLQSQVAQNPNVRIEAMIDQIVPQTVELFTSQMTRAFPQLNAYLTPNMQYSVSQQHAAFDNVKMQIERFKGGMQAPMGMQPPMGMAAPQQGMMMMQPTGYQQPGAMMRGDPRLGGNPGSLGVSLTGPVTSLAPQGVAMAPNPQGNSMAATSRWAMPDLSTPPVRTISIAQQEQQQDSGNVHIARSAMPVQSTTNQTTEASSMNTPVQEQAAPQEGPIEPLATTSLKWKRSAIQPYFPAWDPQQQDLYLQRLATGEVVVKMKVKQKGAEVEYDRHKIPSVFGPALPTLDLSNTAKTLEIVQKGLTEIEQEKKERLESVEPSFSTRVNPNWYVDVSPEMVWLTGSVNWLASMENGKVPDIYRQYGQVVEMIVGTENEDNYIESFRDAGTFVNLHRMLNETQGKCSTQLWYRLNDRITELVNRALEFNLSLTGLTIDSFANDGLDIIEYLGNHYGDTVKGAFLHNQAYLIRSIFESISQENADALDGNFIPHPEEGAEVDPEAKPPVFTHLVSNGSFTFLNCLAHELSLEFDKDHPALLTDRLTPVLYRLAKGIIEDAKSYTGATIGRHFVQTLDGHILEVDTAFLGEEAYLVRKLK
jgi:hypothetical protein